jgi:hypothetical protein
MSPRPGRERRSLVVSAGAASVGAGAIHAAVVPEHLEEAWLFGAFFVACALFQFAWAGAISLSSSPVLSWAGMLGNGAMVAIWTASRTIGLPVGPEPWTPEVVGVLDLVATGLELFIVAAAAWWLSAAGSCRRDSRADLSGPAAG